MGRRRVVGAVALGVLQLGVLVSLAVTGPDDRTHDAPIRVSAPPVVATAVVARANELAGRPVEARAVSTPAAARRSVAHGSSVAAVVVDLRRERDVVLVSSANGAEVNRVVVRQVRAFERSFGRSVEVKGVASARRGDDGARGVYVLVGVCVLLGFVAPVVITWLRGAVARTFALGALRVGVVAVSALAVGLPVGLAAADRYDGGLVAWWLLAALTTGAVATTTMALQSLFGVLGIGVATTLFVLAAAPLVRLTHPLLLPEPWSAVTPWLPHGAALQAGRGEAYFGGASTRPVLVLVVWTATAVLTMVVARRERARELLGSSG